eukprot:gnl/MRDRNA2_/MRDRNA2_98247_c0_seq1.p1 gnl/MRDRNA2_/MRDRNA2_98247_c0~~gnl/MRDRNA2_/MRDRNA2_98247_c0_seq1.p1  ORF type:complete len:210 (+),score=35.87 gnl/MRDRNA2_/MRDRNA2_98247_c0_seq1:80-709(+)
MLGFLRKIQDKFSGNKIALTCPFASATTTDKSTMPGQCPFASRFAGTQQVDAGQKAHETGPGLSNAPPPPLTPGNKTFSLTDLRTCETAVGAPIYTSLLGRVYDVSKGADFFGPGAHYGIFAFHDSTYNLAVMSMKKPTLDSFTYELDEEDKQSLADWIAYFDHNYGAPVGLLKEKHCIALSDLPPALKIPFADSQGASTTNATPMSRL